LTTCLEAAGTAIFRDLVGWSTLASTREVGNLSRGVVSAAALGDTVAVGILDRAATALAQLVNQLAEPFGAASAVPVGFTGGLVGDGGPLQPRVMGLINPPFAPRAAALDPLLGGPRLAR
jgi:N-acetylglucosamine kinase-like BadF-type ATPase